LRQSPHVIFRCRFRVHPISYCVAAEPVSRLQGRANLRYQSLYGSMCEHDLESAGADSPASFLRDRLKRLTRSLPAAGCVDLSLVDRWFQAKRPQKKRRCETGAFLFRRQGGSPDSPPIENPVRTVQDGGVVEVIQTISTGCLEDQSLVASANRGTWDMRKGSTSGAAVGPTDPSAGSVAPETGFDGFRKSRRNWYPQPNQRTSFRAALT
jgi:hypothetical protein